MEILHEVAKKYGTPLYFYDLQEIKRRTRLLKETLKGIDFKVFFAMKSNANLHLLKFMRTLGLGADAVSLNEYRMARFAGFLPDEIIVNGNGKSLEDLEFYLKERPFCLNVDSYEEIEKLNKYGSKMRIALRINPDVDAKTHPHISTGLKENKFGMDIKTVSKIVKNLPPNLDLAGIHCHIGSQIIDVEPFVEAFRSLKKFVDDEDLDLQFVNIGGGWGIDYFKDGDGIDLKNYKNTIVPLLSSFGKPIYLELGRFIVGSAGYLLTHVTEVKHTSDKTFIVVDTSMADLIRPTLYDAYHRIEFLSNSDEIMADVVGRVCESGDTLARERKVNLPQVGDLGVIHDVGAYGYSMASNYNLSIRPAEVAYDGNDFFIIRRRETFEDLLNFMQQGGGE